MNKKIGVVLIATMLAIATVGIASANAYGNHGYGWNQANNGAYNQHNGYGHGHGGYGGVYSEDVNEPVVQSVDDAITEFKSETGIDVSKDNVYQMGRWWVINYSGSDGIIKQGRLDAYTAEVIEDFSNNAYQQNNQPRDNNRFHRGGYGCSGMGYGY
ncbi:conserved hypothetical protein [Methanohalobium evestigatum Z-7303]|uniref:PepSY domain-containing protein n=1 Tax=Methanohalobium evestigatum (strain ATCC BAA-1072 / DSM 3721 / NBRC 107634 / OCM 161 / Z-7303) TaxID=644295 RepID=D7E744_METEZ|nr:hypothetical protein [Methanohalobium evestigatum]ADI73668.1 conserved hypothetical protein [Methanohalobium evestigatum Z-7303]